MFQGVVYGLGCTVSKFNYTGVKLFYDSSKGKKKKNKNRSCPILSGAFIYRRGTSKCHVAPLVAAALWSYMVILLLLVSFC